MAGTLGTIMGQVRLDIRQAVAAYATLRAQNQRTVYAMRGTGDAFVSSGQTMAVGGAAMVYAFGRTVMAAAEFERKMDYASAVSNTTGKQMQKLSDYALQLGQDTIYSASEIADGFIELAKAGVNAEQIIGGIGEAMANLASAGDIPLAQSGQIITSTIQQFDLAARDAVAVTDLLAGAANASIADISDIGVSLKYVGGVANAAGLGLEDTMTAISLLAKAGIRGSTAGTSLRQMIVSLGGATGPAREALSELGILAEDGSNKFFTAEGNAKSLSQVFQILQNSTADLSAKQRLMYLRTIFNNRALSAASILTREGADGFRDMNREMSKTTAADVAAERLDNLSGDIEILRGNIETLMIEAGSPFQEMLRGWVQSLTKLVQWFSDLDPETQKLIMQIIGLSGVILLAMGIFSMIIGTIFRFGVAMIRLAQGAGFLWKILRIVAVNARWIAVLFGGPLIAALGAVSAVVWVVIAVIAALVAGFVIAYKKSETFRNAVDAIASVVWNAIKAVGSFFKLLATDPGAAWDKIKSGVETAFNAVVAWVKRLPGLIGSGLSAAASYVGGFIGRIAGWFASLPGKVLGYVAGLVSKVASYFTFENAGYAIGFLLGTAVRLFIMLRVKLLQIALSLVQGVGRFFQSLPGKVGYALGFLLGKVIGFFLRMQQRAIAFTARLVIGVINFFRRLPGRIASFLANMVVRGIALFNRFRAAAPRIAAQLVTGVIGFIRDLPGKVSNFISNMASRARDIFNRMKDNAVQIGKGIYNGLIDGITGLPGAVSDIFNNVVQAIKDKITDAFNSVRDFASGMWNGFKDGLGINSPSLIEKQMYQMTRVAGEETDKMRKNVIRIQGLSKQLVTRSAGSDNPKMSSGDLEYRRLAMMHSMNQNRARTLMAASQGRPAAPAARPIQQPKGSKIVSGELDLTPNGRAFIRGVAEEVYGDNDSFEVTTTRMGSYGLD